MERRAAAARSGTRSSTTRSFDQLLVGVGNGSPWNQQIRSPGGGDNLFLASIVALDAKTGAYRWHYQTTPGETWDYTATQPIILADLDDRRRHAQGRDAGAQERLLLRGRPHQRQADLREAFSRHAAGEGHARGRAPGLGLRGGSGHGPAPREPRGEIHRAAPCSSTRTPTAGTTGIRCPTARRPGLVYLPTQDMALGYRDRFRHSRGATGSSNIGVLVAPFPDDPQVRKAIRNSAMAALLAWDPVAQKEVWRAKRRGPWNGGTLAVAGGLVFQGTVDGHFLAMDAQTGKELWSYDNQAATLAGPVSYEVEGEQYVAVPAGYGSAFFLILRLLGAPGGSSHQRARLCLQAGGQSTQAGDPAPAHSDPPAARSHDDRGRVCAGDSALRPLLPDLPRCRGDHGRRLARSPQVRKAPGRRPCGSAPSSTGTWRRWACRCSGSTSRPRMPS